MTRLLLLRVPYFRDIILESFECEHCHFKDNSVKSYVLDLSEIREYMRC
jgi:zinc finger protein